MPLAAALRRALRGPVRWWIRHGPSRGRGLLVRHVLDPLVPAAGPLRVALPGGAVADLRYEESLGRVVGWMGAFEPGELAFVARRLRPGDVAFDVGANVGLYTLVMARAVGEGGRVVAVEPHPANLDRLRAHLALNGVGNVELSPAPATEAAGEVELAGAGDPAFTSAVRVLPGHADGSTLRVPGVTLDALWEGMGRPAVRLVKVDVEGAERLVLSGARGLLLGARPVLLLEANGAAEVVALRALLRPLGYRERHPRGFERHIRLFVPM